MTSAIGIENTIGTGTGVVSLVNTYLGPQGDAIAVFKQASSFTPKSNSLSISGVINGAYSAVTGLFGGSSTSQGQGWSNYTQVFAKARPIKCTVRPTSKLMEHPLESGQIISDYKILLPVEVVIQFIVNSQNYKDVYAEIINLYSASTLLTVQSRASLITNVVITELPDEERPDMFDVIMMELKFKQVFLVATSGNFSPQNPTQSNTVNSGNQSATPTTLSPNSTTNNPQAIKTQLGN